MPPTNIDLVKAAIERKNKANFRTIKFQTALTMGLPAASFIAAIILFVHGVRPSIFECVVAVCMYCLAMFGLDGGYHRYFTHSAFRSKPVVGYLLGALGAMAMKGPLFWWVATHRIHHAHADKLGDPHSPAVREEGNLLRRLIHAQVGWLFSYQHKYPKNWRAYCKDLQRNGLARKIDDQYGYFALAGLLLPAAICGIAEQSWSGWWGGLFWGGLVRVFVGHQIYMMINSLGHSMGSRPFATNDRSHNSPLIAFLTLGQGWHNNHHAFPRSARVGLAWWQIDGVWYGLIIMRSLGLISNLRRPTPLAMSNKRRANS